MFSIIYAKLNNTIRLLWGIQMMQRVLCLWMLAVLAFVVPASAITITQTTDATTLTNTILGGGVTLVGTPTFTGAGVQAGTFTSGGVAIGFGSGIVLISGN